MKFFNNKERALSIEITPLIDIVFLLVIFFVVTSKIETNQYLTLDLAFNGIIFLKPLLMLIEILFFWIPVF